MQRDQVLVRVQSGHALKPEHRQLPSIPLGTQLLRAADSSSLKRSRGVSRDFNSAHVNGRAAWGEERALTCGRGLLHSSLPASPLQKVLLTYNAHIVFSNARLSFLIPQARK